MLISAAINFWRVKSYSCEKSDYNLTTNPSDSLMAESSYGDYTAGQEEILTGYIELDIMTRANVYSKIFSFP